MKKVVIDYKELTKKEKIFYWIRKVISGTIYFAILIVLTFSFVYSAMHNSSNASITASAEASADNASWDTIVFNVSAPDSDSEEVLVITLDISMFYLTDESDYTAGVPHNYIYFSYDEDGNFIGGDFSGDIYSIFSLGDYTGLDALDYFISSNNLNASGYASLLFELDLNFAFLYGSSFTFVYDIDNDSCAFSCDLYFSVKISSLYLDNEYLIFDVDCEISDFSVYDTGSPIMYKSSGTYSGSFEKAYSENAFTYSTSLTGTNHSLESVDGYSLAADYGSSNYLINYKYATDNGVDYYNLLNQFIISFSTNLTFRLYSGTIEYYLFYAIYDYDNPYFDPLLFYYNVDLEFTLTYVLGGILVKNSFTLNSSLSVSYFNPVFTGTGCYLSMTPYSSEAGTDSTGDYVDFSFSDIQINYLYGYGSDNDETVQTAFSDCFSKSCTGLSFSLDSGSIVTMTRTASDLMDTGDTSDYDTGYEDGYADGYDYGLNYGFNWGFENGYDVGYSAGYTVAYDGNYDSGYEDGYSYGEEAGYTSGYSDGEEAGYNSGYVAGEAYGAGTTWGNPVVTLLGGVASILSVNLFGYFSLATIIEIGLYIFIALMVIKLFT